MRREIGSVGAIIALLLMALGTSLAHGADGAETTEPAPGSLPEGMDREAAIQEDIEFRRAFGFESDQAYVEGLYDQPETTIGTRVFGALFTEAELERMQARDALSDVAAVIQSYYDSEPARAENFAGLAVDDAGEMSVLAVYLLNTDDAPWTADLTAPQLESVSIRQAQVNVATLLALQSELDEEWSAVWDIPIAERRAADSELADIVSTGIDYSTNEVVVSFDVAQADLGPEDQPEAIVARRFDAGAPSRPIRTEVAERPDVSRRSWLRAGWTYDPMGCTFAFKVDRVRAAESPHRFMLSAGHCFNHVGRVVFHRGADVGKVIKKAFERGKPDAALIRVDGNTTAPKFRAAAQVARLTDGVPYLLDVRGPFPHKDVQGEKICMTGRTSGTTCGKIESVNVTLETRDAASATTVVLPNMVKVRNIRRNTGDSGGPAYFHDTRTNTVLAAGVLSSTNVERRQAFYSKLGKIRGLGWNVKLATKPDSSGCSIGGFGPGDPCPIDKLRHLQ